MRLRRLRLLGATLALLFLPLTGCSSQQQEGEQLDTEQGEDGGGENAPANNEEGGGENAPANNEEGGGENEATNNEEGAANNEEGGDNETAGGNATENDLQEIIQEMNGQQTAGADAPAGGDQPLPNDAAATNPAATPPANTAAATPPPAAETPAATPPPAAAPNPIPFQPGGTPAAPGLPESGSKLAYIVQHGDTLAKISGKIYGTPGRWNELAKLSGLANPSRIFPGDLVYYTLDESAVAFATAYEQVQRQEEQVKPGDTLATIAQRVYGDYKSWRSIWRQNDKIDNPDRIPPGTTVYYIPKGSLTAAINKVKAEMAAKLVKSGKGTTLASKAKSGKSAAKKFFKNSLTTSKKIGKADAHKLAGSKIMSAFGALQFAQFAQLALN